MTEAKKLTGIKEQADGYVGRPPLFSRTKTGDVKVWFDIYCGMNNSDNNKYPILRHCVAYRDKAESLRGMAKGDYVNCRGWLSREALRDEYGNVITENGVVKTIEHLVLWEAKVTPAEAEKTGQLPLDKTLVGNAK